MRTDPPTFIPRQFTEGARWYRINRELDAVPWRVRLPNDQTGDEMYTVYVGGSTAIEHNVDAEWMADALNWYVAAYGLAETLQQIRTEALIVQPHRSP